MLHSIGGFFHPWMAGTSIVSFHTSHRHVLPPMAPAIHGRRRYPWMAGISIDKKMASDGLYQLNQTLRRHLSSSSITTLLFPTVIIFGISLVIAFNLKTGILQAFPKQSWGDDEGRMMRE